MTVALAAILAGALLVYAGVKGKSVTALLLGNSQVDQGNQSLIDQSSSSSGSSGGSSQEPPAKTPVGGQFAQSGPGGSPFGGPGGF